MQEIEILIVGSGPAGASTALHLAQVAPELVPRTLILEKAHHPRPKLCGGGLVIDAEVMLERLGLDVTEIPHTDANLAYFDFEGRGLAVRVPGRHALRMIRRDAFDAWLAEKVRQAGFELREGVTVTDVRPGENGVTVETDAGAFQARAVVGADGSNGVVRRCVLPESPLHTARLLEVLTPTATTTPSQLPPNSSNSGEGREGVAFFDFFPVPEGIAGYVWDFPTQVEGQPMRCWGVYDTNLLADRTRPPLKTPLAEEMARHGYDLSACELQGHPIRWFSPRRAFSVPGVLLAGDAAGADGIFGEGISLALGYGQVAAQALKAAFDRDEFSFSDYRRRLLSSPLGHALGARWAITHILYRLHWRWFQKWFWRSWKFLIIPISWLLVINWARRTKPPNA
jgi:flavin-dependent dehydrogenase